MIEALRIDLSQYKEARKKLQDINFAFKEMDEIVQKISDPKFKPNRGTMLRTILTFNSLVVNLDKLDFHLEKSIGSELTSETATTVYDPEKDL